MNCTLSSPVATKETLYDTKWSQSSQVNNKTYILYRVNRMMAFVTLQTRPRRLTPCWYQAWGCQRIIATTNNQSKQKPAKPRPTTVRDHQCRQPTYLNVYRRTRGGSAASCTKDQHVLPLNQVQSSGYCQNDTRPATRYLLPVPEPQERIGSC